MMSGDNPPPPATGVGNLTIPTINGSDLRRSTNETCAPTSTGSLSSSQQNAKYKLMSPAKLPISRSPCLTIPSGLSPTSFLESPVLLSNFKGEPSPTTGSFFKPQMIHNSSGGSTTFPSIMNSSRAMEANNSSSFEFKPDSGSFGGFTFGGPLVPSADSNQQQAGQVMQVPPESQPQPSESSIAVKSEVGANNELRSSMVAPSSGLQREVDSNELNQTQDSNNESQGPQSEQKGVGSQVISERTSDDGYNWRKYGQKLVKGSEFPRSYYKCTHPNCEVKKLFERSPDGQITEIIYKGTHDHPKPQPNRRLPAGSMMSSFEEKSERVPLTVQEGKPANSFAQTVHNSEPNSTPELPPCGANDNSGEGGVSQLNRMADDADDDDPFAKRRRMEIGEMDINSVVKPIREPRVVVQTVSEVDILDDGYRWRKYGQKVVRGNPNPRSYYKCTHPGCPVRKHVERASHDPKAVITTYEGKHNHEVPTARNSSHDTAAPASTSLASQMGSHEGSEAVSLDLGVGIRSGPDFTPGQPPAMDASQQPQFSGANLLLLQPAPISSFPGYVNGGMVLYGSRENHSTQGHNNIGNPPVNHSSNPYQQNMGRILMGP
uniref:WRKY DNA-binding protein 25 n=1 Tax=Sesuvium portulacastrum TaxID=221166 RepID=A0A2I7ZAQ0_SESPO|nr:WRKY DNA-binding protein 25 [Sesuvium portulacastrum]